ncbi:FadR/GntR family transcriptional regulator, partial [Corallococcus aberystwythensis]
QRRLPRNGGLASERKMARRYGVCRGTVREALRRLAARGLVVLRPGRQARAVALDESLTLENLGLALHDTRTQESRRLLEGFFSLKRQVLVELLSDCCANASAVALGPLESTCYALQDAARWYHPKERCAQLEFELLRLSAQVASRPGHLLLIQSLQRAFRGIADRLLPFMGGDAMRQWVICALDALYARDVQALQHQLPALMKTYDELVLDQLAPVPREDASPKAPHAQEGHHCAPASATSQDDAPEGHPCIETPGPGDLISTTRQDDAFEVQSCAETRGLGAPTSVTEQDDAFEARDRAEERGLGRFDSATEDSEVLGSAPRPRGQVLPLVPDSEALGFPAALPPTAYEPGGEDAGGHVTGVDSSNLSNRRAGWDTASPEDGLQSKEPSSDSRERTHEAVSEAGGPVHGTLDPPSR